MNEEEFSAFSSLKDTQVTFLESGHDPITDITDKSPAEKFAYNLHQLRRQHSGNGSRVFMALGGPTVSQLSYSLKYVIHGQDIGYNLIEPVIVGTAISTRKCQRYIDKALEMVGRFESFDSLSSLAKVLEEYINISIALSLRSINENDPLTQEPVRQERDEFHEQTLDDILALKELDEHILARKAMHKDMEPEQVQEKIKRRDELATLLKAHHDELDTSLSVGMYATLCNSIEEIINIMNGSSNSWTIERYKSLLAGMKKHLYSFDQRDAVQNVLSRATTIYAGGGRADYAKRNMDNLGGFEWMSAIVTGNRIPWQGYSMGCDMVLDNMDLFSYGPCSTNNRGQMVVNECGFIPFGKGLGLVKRLTIVVHGETYLPNMECQDLSPEDGLNRIVVPELRHKGETFVYINNASIVKAENNGHTEYRAFIGNDSSILFYHRGVLIEKFGSGQHQLNVKALNSERDRIEYLYQEEMRKSA